MNKLLAVIILTHNEELHIARAIQSVAGLASEVLVVDSGSSDNTVAIARSAGARVLFNPFENYSRQFQWALDNGNCDSEWILRLDADEVIDPELNQELLQKIPGLSKEVTAIYLKRRHIFMGRWIRRGGRYPLILLRIWRTGYGRIESRWMDEHIVINAGSSVTMKNYFSDVNLNGIEYFTQKHNKYALREALDVLIYKYNLRPTDNDLRDQRDSTQAGWKRIIKEQLYNRIHFVISSTLYFVWRYVFQLGFLDGLPGLIYHFLQGWWYRFLVGVYIVELDASIATLTSADEMRARLKTLTGHSV